MQVTYKWDANDIKAGRRVYFKDNQLTRTIIATNNGDSNGTVFTLLEESGYVYDKWRSAEEVAKFITERNGEPL